MGRAPTQRERNGWIRFGCREASGAKRKRFLFVLFFVASSTKDAHLKNGRAAAAACYESHVKRKKYKDDNVREWKQKAVTYIIHRHINLNKISTGSHQKKRSYLPKI